MRWLDMSNYRPAGRHYWWTMTVVGGGIIVYSIVHVTRQPGAAAAVAFLGGLLAASVALFPVRIPGLRISLVCGDIFIVLTLLLAGLPAAVLAGAAEGFVGAVRTSRRWTSRLLTPAHTAAWLAACGIAFEIIRPAAERVLPDPLGLLLSTTAFGFMYFLVSVGAQRLFIAWRDGKPVRFIAWWLDAYLIGLWFITSAAVAALIYLSLRYFGWPALLVAMPVLVMFLATYYSLVRSAEHSRRKSEFLAQMSHELRTPLNAIIGGSQILEDGVVGPLSERQAQWAHDIHESGEHLLAVINDILDISKIEAGRMDLSRAPFEVGAIIASALTLVKDAAARKGVELASEVAPDAGVVAADERKMKQVLLNLLSNAIKFTPRGGRVTVTGRREGGAIVIAVRDTGIGIAREDHEAAFDAFRQVGKDAAAKAMGTGLGLTLARDLVVLHGGTLGLESEPGRGSVFTVRLPDRR